MMNSRRWSRAVTLAGAGTKPCRYRQMQWTANSFPCLSATHNCLNRSSETAFLANLKYFDPESHTYFGAMVTALSMLAALQRLWC